MVTCLKRFNKFPYFLKIVDLFIIDLGQNAQILKSQNTRPRKSFNIFLNKYFVSNFLKKENFISDIGKRGHKNFQVYRIPKFSLFDFNKKFIFVG